MKGLLLAAGAFLLLVALSVVLLRFYRGKKHYKVFLSAFALAVGFYIVLYRALPENLGFVPPGWLEPHRTLDFLNGLLILTLGFVGFWDSVYTTVLTGFSANLMVLLAEGGELSREEILGLYGAGKKLDRVLAWRLPKLIEGNYLEAEGAGYRL
ncbi:MAG: hypothetical protein ACE5JS_06660, partial [Nitrospinota bacterium]